MHFSDGQKLAVLTKKRDGLNRPFAVNLRYPLVCQQSDYQAAFRMAKRCILRQKNGAGESAQSCRKIVVK
nr:MAG TPA: hypothetical protein [Caudoviricetes sp.]